MRSAAAILATAFIVGSMGLSYAQEETVVKKPDGETVTVRTDEAGTTVSKEPKAEAAAVPPTPSEQQHNNAVHELTKDGGKVESKTETAR